MSILLSDSISIPSSLPVDYKYGPYSSTIAANSAIPIGSRYVGLTVGIGTTTVAEYWYNGGTSDDKLVVKSAGGGGGGGGTSPGGDIVGTTAAQTLTNKRITPRVGTSTGGTYSLNSNNLDVVTIIPTSDITITVDAGSPEEGQKLIFRVASGSTSYNLTFTNAIKGCRQVGVTVHNTTVAGRVMYIGCMYNYAVGIWDIIAYTVLA